MQSLPNSGTSAPTERVVRIARLMRRRSSWIVLVVASIAWMTYAALSAAGPGAAPVESKQAKPVTTTRASLVNLPAEIEARGHVVAINQIEIRPQIDGIVRRIGFSEGQQVQSGQVLFELDAEDAVAELARADAEILRVSAQLEDAISNLNRSRDLLASGYISSSAIDTLESRRKALSAELQAARATAAGSKAKVERATIRAPIQARAGMLTVREGGRVRQADADALVMLRQFDPIGVDFSLPERELRKVNVAKGRGRVSVQVKSDDGFLANAELTVMDNTIEQGTGTIRLRVEMANVENRFWPGAFVRVSLRITEETKVTVLPPQAVAEGPDGHFVYTVSDDGIAIPVPVRLLRLQSGVVVVEGLAQGTVVIVEGKRSVLPGDRVHVTDHSGPDVVHFNGRQG